jgi:hypothetical protein
MLAHHWGIKTVYYSLVDKQGSKDEADEAPLEVIDFFEDDESCESCKL